MTFTHAANVDDAIALVVRFWALMAGNDFDAVAMVLADDFVLDWSQSNERIRGAARFAQMNRKYPAHGPWRFGIRRLFGSGDQVVSETAISDSVQSALAISFFTVTAGRISRLVEYWPEPYPAPANRAHLVEPIG